MSSSDTLYRPNSFDRTLNAKDLEVGAATTDAVRMARMNDSASALAEACQFRGLHGTDLAAIRQVVAEEAGKVGLSSADMDELAARVSNLMLKAQSYYFYGGDGAATSPTTGIRPYGPLSPFPEGRGGPVRGENGLSRTHYFDGRFLDGKALERDQVYWDARARMLAAVHDPGVVWGLEVHRYGEADAPATETGAECLAPPPAVGKDDLLWLKAGLAFDGVGRPITVPSDHWFTLSMLLGGTDGQAVVVKSPGSRVLSLEARSTAGATRTDLSGVPFAPCCTTPSSSDLPTATSGIAAGPYILRIFATECPAGESKVHGRICSTGARTCTHDAWQGGFYLALVRYPCDAPNTREIEDSWRRRGLIAAHYLDVFERDASRRWHALLDDAGADFAQGPGPRGRLDQGVALAMIYVEEGGQARWIDPWMVRRPVVSTAADAWAARLRGSSARAQAIARLHQFQDQLREGLATAPLGLPGARQRPFNLYDRGFRHLPPAGFLPLPDPEGTTLHGAHHWARAWFDGTNVLPIDEVALQDDDLSSLLEQALLGPPIVLEPMRAGDFPGAQLTQMLAGLMARFHAWWQVNRACMCTTVTAATIAEVDLLLAVVLGALRSHRLDFAALVRRDLELVRLVLPARGTNGVHPDVARMCGVADPGVAPESPGCGTVRFRPMALFVKHRPVLLEGLYIVAQMLVCLLDKARDLGKVPQLSSWTRVMAPEVATIDELAASLNYLARQLLPWRLRRKSGTVGAALVDPALTAEIDSQSMEAVLGAAMPEAMTQIRQAWSRTELRSLALGVVLARCPGLLARGLWEQFLELRKLLAECASDKQLRIERKRKWTRVWYLRPGDPEALWPSTTRAIDLVLDEHPAMGGAKLLAVALGPERFEDVVEELCGRAAEVSGDGAGGRLVHQAVLGIHAYGLLHLAWRKPVYRKVRRLIGCRTLFALLCREWGASAGTKVSPLEVALGGLTVNQILCMTKADLLRRLGRSTTKVVIEGLTQHLGRAVEASAQLADAELFQSFAFAGAYKMAIDRSASVEEPAADSELARLKAEVLRLPRDKEKALAQVDLKWAGWVSDKRVALSTSLAGSAEAAKAALDTAAAARTAAVVATEKKRLEATAEANYQKRIGALDTKYDPIIEAWAEAVGRPVAEILAAPAAVAPAPADTAPVETVVEVQPVLTHRLAVPSLVLPPASSEEVTATVKLAIGASKLAMLNRETATIDAEVAKAKVAARADVSARLAEEKAARIEELSGLTPENREKKILAIAKEYAGKEATALVASDQKIDKEYAARYKAADEAATAYSNELAAGFEAEDTERKRLFAVTQVRTLSAEKATFVEEAARIRQAAVAEAADKAKTVGVTFREKWLADNLVALTDELTKARAEKEAAYEEDGNAQRDAEKATVAADFDAKITAVNAKIVGLTHFEDGKVPTDQPTCCGAVPPRYLPLLKGISGLGRQAADAAGEAEARAGLDSTQQALRVLWDELGPEGYFEFIGTFHPSALAGI